MSAFLRHYQLTPCGNILLCENFINHEKEGELRLLEDFISILDSNRFEYGIEDMIRLFEFVISPAEKEVNGAVYTPSKIRKTIINHLLADLSTNDISRFKYADLSCGCGGFLVDLAVEINKITGKPLTQICHENIFGLDITDYAIERTKLLLSFVCILRGEDRNIDFNLWVTDALSFDMNTIGQLDVIVGNPPYVCGRNISEECKNSILKWRVCASGNTDLYIPFIQLAIESIKDGGRMGYITMNSFLNSLNGRVLRDYLQEGSWDLRIIDFRDAQIFEQRATYTCLFLLNKSHSDIVHYCHNSNANLSKFCFQEVKYNELNSEDSWPLNDFNNVQKFENTGIPLGLYCKSRHGIATLCNSIYVFKPTAEDDKYYFLTRNGVSYRIEKNICKDIVNSNLLNSENSIEEIVEKIIYPYFVDDADRAIIIPEGELIEKYPFTHKYLSAFRERLEERDKGKGRFYNNWYQFGRTQSLVMPKYKLFFPKIANKRLHCILNSTNNLLLYNGMCFISEDKRKLTILQRILESSIFWNYILKNSKPYSSGYLSLNGANIKHFGIPSFTSEQEAKLLSLKSNSEIDIWLAQFYK
jgi:hypothetical protein